ncbi:MAG: sulfite oxidase-like oxidoreductase [Bryobacter sp.]|jgi:DMSO/TMAO reductase YedYZ molybdopterin-dependent catalytic subunit|nr:sulfite oxidase-like oxidoreductase [Bryobacter sp. CoA8 C33]
MIISPDTKRERRIPPGQSQTLKWPVLDASGTPPIDMGRWRLEVFGLVEREVSLDWEEFQKLPRVEVFSDFHCVTRWSRLDNSWSGVAVKTLLELAGGVKREAKFVSAMGYDYGWTTNLPLEEFLVEDVLVATHHDGEPLTPEHGGPARLVVPRLYAWKSAKWLGGLELLAEDRAGFWERNGYHMHGDPWKEERFGY